MFTPPDNCSSNYYFVNLCMVYAIQNDRTDQTKKMQKWKLKKSWEVYQKLSKTVQPIQRQTDRQNQSIEAPSGA